MGKKIRVGIISNEFLDPELGRMGGFGWAASRAAEVLNRKSAGRFEAVFLSGELNRRNSSVNETNGTKLILNTGKWYRDIFPLSRERIDILLSIDYRPSYNAVINALPRTPLIVWVRDPKTPDDYKILDTLRVPGKEDVIPAGLPVIRSGILAKYVNGPWFLRRRVFLANKMPHIAAKNAATYNLPASELVLPNPDVLDYDKFSSRTKSSHPKVVFLGRFDPIKRPWIYLELARKFPDTEFVMMGKNHFSGAGNWKPEDIPENVVLTGHLSGHEKYNMLSSAWVLVNTSIHEESPVSVFEAFALRTPVISFGDWGGLISRFGISVGPATGTGLDKLPQLVDALQALLADHTYRNQLGEQARDWVRNEQNDQRFLEAFESICRKAGAPV